jgi:hypothetical protein
MPNNDQRDASRFLISAPHLERLLRVFGLELILMLTHAPFRFWLPISLVLALQTGRTYEEQCRLLDRSSRTSGMSVRAFIIAKSCTIASRMP